MKQTRLCLRSIVLVVIGLSACQQSDKSETDHAAEDTAMLQAPQKGEGLGPTGEEPSPLQEQSAGTEVAPSEPVHTEMLAGDFGSSSQWGSGWLDLATPMDFGKGDRLRLRIGGQAANILVRLLPRGTSPDSSVGMIGGAISVPEGRVVEVDLDTDHKEIVQISVHGGPNPWGRFPLGAGNESATIEAAELIRR
jgi:hypothetical protein